jgi:hypothetical protein
VDLAVEHCAERQIYRISFSPDPWQPPGWEFVADKFANRWDDPLAVYRVVYGSSHRRGCFLETLARFRSDPAVLIGLQEIEGDDDFVEPAGVPREWLTPRVISAGGISGEYADVGHSSWIGYMSRPLARECVRYGVSTLDAAALYSAAPRGFTQAASRFVFESASGYAGIRYLSRFGHDIENWAIFEPFGTRIRALDSGLPIEERDPDLEEAMSRHGLHWS